MNRFPGIRALRTLEAAGRHLNYTKAEEELGLTPAAVSHQVKEFQQQLGVTLFERTGRELRHTPAGEALHIAIADALKELVRAGLRVKQIRSTTRLQISTPASIASKWLLPRIKKFMQFRPDVDVGIDITKIVRDFDRDGVDVSFRWGDGDYPGLRADRVFEHSIFPVCSPKLLDSCPLTTPRQLLDFNLIHVDWGEAGVVWPDWHRWLHFAGIEEFHERPGLHFHETVHAVQAAIDGHGIALGDAALVADDLAAGRLVRPFELAIGAPKKYAYYVTCPIETGEDPLIKLFRDWVRDEASQTTMQMEVEQTLLSVAESPQARQFNRPTRES